VAAGQPIHCLEYNLSLCKKIAPAALTEETVERYICLASKTGLVCRSAQADMDKRRESAQNGEIGERLWAHPDAAEGPILQTSRKG
jgi:hypothetical protein